MTQQIFTSFLALVISASLLGSQGQEVCSAAGYCQGGELISFLHVLSARDCLLECKAVSQCNWYTFQQPSSNCLLFADCPTLDETCDDCISGEKACQEEDSEPFWHMIIGGYSYPFNDSTVELFNWLTGEQCLIDNLPIEIFDHSATVMDGVPIFCGGQSNYHAEQGCHTYNVQTGIWEMFSDLLEKTYKGSGVLVPNQGWHIFGGAHTNQLAKAQKLVNLDSEWEEGPELYSGGDMYGICSVQLDNQTTVFFGTDDKHGIVTLDWSTLEYTKQPISLLGSRTLSSCALLKGRRGEPLVAVAGGLSKGMEIWNPADKFVETVTFELPPEVGATSGVEGSQLVPTKLGSEAILYGGWRKTGPVGVEAKDIHQPGIWKFKVSDHSWTKVGSMLHARHAHAVIPVAGVKCL